MKHGMQVGLGPGHIVLDGDPGHPVPYIYCGQTAGWIKMPLGTQVNVGPDDVVLDGVAAPPLSKRGTAPSFRFMSIVAKWLDVKPPQNSPVA